jgi:hypothetical protein
MKKVFEALLSFSDPSKSKLAQKMLFNEAVMAIYLLDHFLEIISAFCDLSVMVE